MYASTKPDLTSVEQIIDLVIMYERTKYINTSQARRIINRKNPENDEAFDTAKKFASICDMYDISPAVFYQSLYKDGKLLVPRRKLKEEFAVVISKPAKFYYENSWIPANRADGRHIPSAIQKTESNIKLVCDIMNTKMKEGGIYKDFMHLRAMNRMYPEWIYMLKCGLISPMFLFAHGWLKQQARHIPGSERKDMNRFAFYETLYDRYNVDGKLDKIIKQRFGVFLPDDMHKYAEDFERMEYENIPF